MTPRDPFADFEDMRREMDELFGDVLRQTRITQRRGFSPRVDVYYEGDPPRAVVEVELSGVDPGAVALEISGRQLLIAGERRGGRHAGRAYQQLEIEHGPFRRIVELGADVAADQASAGYEDGVLRITIPLVSQRRRVPIAAPDREDEGTGGDTGASAGRERP